LVDEVAVVVVVVVVVVVGVVGAATVVVWVVVDVDVDVDAVTVSVRVGPVTVRVVLTVVVCVGVVGDVVVVEVEVSLAPSAVVVLEVVAGSRAVFVVDVVGASVVVVVVAVVAGASGVLLASVVLLPLCVRLPATLVIWLLTLLAPSPEPQPVASSAQAATTTAPARHLRSVMTRESFGAWTVHHPIGMSAAAGSGCRATPEICVRIRIWHAPAGCLDSTLRRTRPWSLQAHADMPDALKLRLPCTARSVRETRMAITALARAAGMPEEKVEELQLAVSEAATNAVRHGSEDDGELLVQASTTDGALQVWITDRGGGMRPRIDRGGLGLGLPIIASVTDQLEVVTDSDGTTVKMTFLFGRSIPGPDAGSITPTG
jgi:anti-sigma regulatory factor (Ser/Thr protein kinase)